MKRESYICKKCGVEFSPLQGQEEQPVCPECGSETTDKVDRASGSVQFTTCCAPKKSPFS